MGFKFKINLPKKGALKKAVGKLEKRLAGNKIVRVGIPKDTAPYPDGTSTAMVAAVHEFGAKIPVTPQMRKFFFAVGHPLRKSTTHITIPERSFLRSSVRENQKKYVTFLRKAIVKIVLGKLDANTAAEMLGKMAADDAQEKLYEIDTPPNSAMTIERKGSDNPLVDTGHLVRSITYEVQDAKD